MQSKSVQPLTQMGKFLEDASLVGMKAAVSVPSKHIDSGLIVLLVRPYTKEPATIVPL
jgi:hypothetical protein